MLVIRGAVGQVWGMRMMILRAWCMSLAGVCHSAQRSVLGRARRRRVRVRVRCWNQRTRVSAQVTRASQARLVSSSSRSAVELRLGEIRRRLPQDLIRPPQFTTLPPELLQLGLLIRSQPGPDALIGLSPPNPLTQRLRRTPEHLRYRTNRRPLRTVIPTMLRNHPNSPLPNLR